MNAQAIERTQIGSQTNQTQLLQLLEQEKHKQKLKFSLREAEFENRLSELQADCKAYKAQLTDKESQFAKSEKVSDFCSFVSVCCWRAEVAKQFATRFELRVFHVSFGEFWRAN